MRFQKLADLVERFKSLGATRVLCKPLSENDNSKQQIYLGGSFEVLQLLPYKSIRADEGFKRETFKAELAFSWIDAAGHVAEAVGAQLILYPKYPEVRLSGFLRGCAIAPSAYMRPVPRDKRASSGPDGRLLFLATTPANSVLAYLAIPSDALAQEFKALLASRSLLQIGVFHELPIYEVGNSRDALLARLRQIHAEGWHSSRRLNRSGVAIPYTAQNGGGYTLEALFGIVPNGISAPDFLGWELKAYSSGRVTLMTPEPDTGYYGDKGVEAFVRRYGRPLEGDVLYFTGTHRANVPCPASGQTLIVRGFNLQNNKIVDIDGGIELLDSARNVSAGWSFRGLIEHWGRKHASTAYVQYTKKAAALPQYKYLSPVLLGEGTDFIKYLTALLSGSVVYDPGSKVVNASSRPRTKARSQFRIAIAGLSSLYHRFNSTPLI
jgi:hypothetical protein